MLRMGFESPASRGESLAAVGPNRNGTRPAAVTRPSCERPVHADKRRPVFRWTTDDKKTRLVGPCPRRRPPVREAPSYLDSYTEMAALDGSALEKNWGGQLDGKGKAVSSGASKGRPPREDWRTAANPPSSMSRKTTRRKDAGKHYATADEPAEDLGRFLNHKPIWDTATGQPLTAPLRHPYTVRGVAFGPDLGPVVIRRMAGTRALTIKPAYGRLAYAGATRPPNRRVRRSPPGRAKRARGRP